jgi:glycosyltransferase involved in cell wall biosynthesis
MPENEAEAPFVSVVVPCYNHAHFVGQTIDAVLAQDYPNFEIIIVDDGSTDNSAEVVQAYGDARVRYVYRENGGLPAARNTGIKNARYDFIGFLDADDTWEPRFLRMVMATFAEKGEDYGIVVSNRRYIDEHGNAVAHRTQLSTPGREVTQRELIQQTFFSTALVARASVFEQVGLFDESLRSTEDRDMWIRVSGVSKIFWMTEKMAMIRRHSGQMSGNAARMLEANKIVLGKAWRAGYVSKLNFLFWLRAWSLTYYNLTWTAYDHGLRGRAIRHTLWSILLWPIVLDPNWINQPPLFRIRALRNFLFRPPPPERDKAG